VYVVGASKVSAFYFNGATLNEIAGSPMPLAWGANASGIVVN
jgi:hypothetical protein